MEILSVPGDCVRLIALHLNTADVSAMIRVCRQFKYVISSDAFWMMKLTKDFEIPMNKVTEICEKYTLPPNIYYRRYLLTRDVDSLMRTWIQPQDIPRFYSAIVRFFRDRTSDRGIGIDSAPEPNDIWIYGERNTGKTSFINCLTQMGKGLKYVGRWPDLRICVETSNRLYIKRREPREFGGSVFEFRNVFPKPDPYNKFAVDTTKLYTNWEMTEYLYILTTLYE